MVGRELVAWLARTGQHQVTGVVRRTCSDWPSDVDQLVIADLANETDCDAIAARMGDPGALIHLAALTPGKIHSATEYHRANAQATANLTRAAVAAGVPRLIYLSSTHTTGALSATAPIDENSPIDPNGDVYGASKLAGEEAVKNLANGASTRWTIVRAPLVYGPGAKGSLALLARAIVRGIPLPIGSIADNSRDMIGVRNLSAFLELCLNSNRAHNETFVVCDGFPLSTRQLAGEIARAAGRTPRLVRFPASAMRVTSRVIGAHQLVERLIGNHRVDDSKARRLLGWSAPEPLSFDLTRMVVPLL